ncbi:MAG: DUF308 domain-containing protein [Clostridia bacterium]|nr:DUF308 domain-containing protein [Clostridia bacterium]
MNYKITPFKNNIPLIVLAAFEIAAGTLLLIDPESFPRAVIIIFGSALVLIGALYLARVLRDKNDGVSSLTMTIALSAVIVGVPSVAFSRIIVRDLIEYIAIIYGAMLLISGIYKAKSYTDSKNAKTPAPVIALLGALAAMGIGIAVMIGTFKESSLMYLVVAASFLAGAALDVLAVVLNAKVKRGADANNTNKAVK